MMTGQGLGPLLAGPLGAIIAPGPAMAVCGLLLLGSVALLRRAALTGPAPATVPA